MTAAGVWFTVAAEHVNGAIRVAITAETGSSVHLLLLPDQADALAAAIAERVCLALDACDLWTAAGVAELEAHGNGATR